MKILWVLSFIALIIQVYVTHSQLGPPDHLWGSPEQVQLAPPRSVAEPEWHPRRPCLVDQCKCLPKYDKNIGFTPIVEVAVVHDSVYPCDLTSRVKQVSYQTTVHSKVTCNGVIVTTSDDWYDFVYADPSCDGKKERVTITNYTQITDFNNGNRNYYECGTIASGRCAGDKISGVSIVVANDQTGCCNCGNTGDVTIFRTLVINGKCESRCTLGQSTHLYAVPVSNRGPPQLEAQPDYVLVSPEQDQLGPQQSEGQPDYASGSPEHDQLGPPQSEGEPEWHPSKPCVFENQCKCVPKDTETIGYTPIVEVGVVVADSVYPCDLTSRVKEISYQTTSVGSKTTCNGIIVSTSDDWYDFVYADPSCDGKKERVTITNYTQITYYNNGNSNYYECGTIASGRCAGDKISGISIAQVNDQTGCCNGGFTSDEAVFRTLVINGKCETRCTLGRSTYLYSEPVSNRGLTNRGLTNRGLTNRGLTNRGLTNRGLLYFRALENE